MRLTVAMPVHNEARRYLAEVLATAKAYATEIVVLDDCSTDDSAAVCRRFGARVHRSREPLFANEVRLRTMLWDLAVATRPDWVVMLDADEILGADFAAQAPALMAQEGVDWLAVRLYDLWNDRHHYRDDALWNAHKRWWPIAVRYRPGRWYRFPDRAHHCSRLPVGVMDGPGANCDARLLHLGWVTEADRRRKYERYMRLDPEGRWGGGLAQYESILDAHPHVVEIKGVAP